MAASMDGSDSVVINIDAINIDETRYNNRAAPPDSNALELALLGDGWRSFRVPMVQRRPPQTEEAYFLYRQERPTSDLQNFGGSINKEVDKDEPEGRGSTQALHTGSRPTGSMSSAEQSVQINEADPTPSGRSSSEEPKP
ncbi:hypothetical protein U1Q18_019351 [Sarracenia purpurea var. burkii]